jgi:hypothetical protein
VALSGNYEIVAISTYKNTFFNDLDYKADIGQHFHKIEKSARRHHRHKIIKTNLKTLVSPLLTRPQGSHGCQKMRQYPLNMPVEVWCAKIAPKLKNIRKSLRKQGFFWHLFFNFDGFWSLCLLEKNSFIRKIKNVIFWHKWDPWGCVNSGKTFFWVQTATVLEVQANPKNMAQKTDAIFSIYGRNGIIPWHFF